MRSNCASLVVKFDRDIEAVQIGVCPLHLPVKLGFTSAFLEFPHLTQWKKLLETSSTWYLQILGKINIYASGSEGSYFSTKSSCSLTSNTQILHFPLRSFVSWFPLVGLLMQMLAHISTLHIHPPSDIEERRNGIPPSSIFPSFVPSGGNVDQSHIRVYHRMNK